MRCKRTPMRRPALSFGIGALLPLFFAAAFLPPYAVAAFFLCAALHEAGHFCILLFLHVPVEAIRFGFGGVTVETRKSALSYRKEVLLHLAGPAVNLFSVPAFFLLPPSLFRGAMTAESLILGLFNLLPSAALDGGHALHATLLMHLPADRADRIFETAAFLFAVLVWLTGAGILTAEALLLPPGTAVGAPVFSAGCFCLFSAAKGVGKEEFKNGGKARISKEKQGFQRFL